MAPSKPLKQIANENITKIGDPISLKSEAQKQPNSDPNPNTNQTPTAGGHKSLKTLAENKLGGNATMLGDPVSLKAESSDTEPTDLDRGAASGDRTGDDRAGGGGDGDGGSKKRRSKL